MVRLAAPVPAPRSKNVNESDSSKGSSSPSIRQCAIRCRSRSLDCATHSFTTSSDFQIEALVSAGLLMSTTLLTWRSGLCRRLRYGAKHERAVSDVDVHRRILAEAAIEEADGQPVTELALDGPL